jgi:hypothetical protein
MFPYYDLIMIKYIVNHTSVSNLRGQNSLPEAEVIEEEIESTIFEEDPETKCAGLKLSHLFFRRFSVALLCETAVDVSSVKII